MRWTLVRTGSLLALAACTAAQAGDLLPPPGPTPTAPVPAPAAPAPGPGCSACGAGGCASDAPAACGGCSAWGHRWSLGAGCGCGLFGGCGLFAGWDHGPGWANELGTWVNPYECGFYGRCVSNYALAVPPGVLLPGLSGPPVPGALLPVPGARPPATLPPVAPPAPKR